KTTRHNILLAVRIHERRISYCWWSLRLLTPRFERAWPLEFPRNADQHLPDVISREPHSGSTASPAVLFHPERSRGNRRRCHLYGGNCKVQGPQLLEFFLANGTRWRSGYRSTVQRLVRPVRLLSAACISAADWIPESDRDADGLRF